MLVKQSLTYLLSRGVPSLINFLTVLIYTRLLAPELYGEYRLILSTVTLLNSSLMWWLVFSLERFFPSYSDKGRFLSNVMFSYLSIIILTGILALVIYSISYQYPWHKHIIWIVLLFWFQGWFEINLGLSRIDLKPLWYGILSITKSLIAIFMGIVLFHAGMGINGPLIALLMGLIIASAMYLVEWKMVRYHQISFEIIRTFSVYGVPLMINFALSFFVNSSDRFLIAHFWGTTSAGLYSASYDLAKFSLITLMMTVHLAAYPLVVHRLEKQGLEAAHQQLQKNFLLLLLISLPATLGMCVLTPEIAYVLLPPQFHSVALQLLPWIALGSLAFGIKSYYFDMSFLLSKNTRYPVVITLVAAITNLVSNLIFIPKLGMIAAAYSTLGCFVLTAFLSWMWGRRIFRLPAFSSEVWKIALAALLMTLILFLQAQRLSGLGLLLKIVEGILIYAGLLFLLNTANIRKKLIGV